MRYERLELDLSTKACDILMDIIGNAFDGPSETRAEQEIANLYNELRARLQRRDPDPKCPKNEEDWLNT